MILSIIKLEATLGQTIFNFVLFLLLLYGIRPTVIGPLTSKRFDKKYPQLLYFYGVILFTLSVFGYSDLDYWGYKSIITRIVQTRREIHVEPIYTWLALTFKDYTLWRFIVWCGATILMIKTVKRLPVNKTTTLFFITIIYALHFYKLRNALGFSLIYWGLTVLCSSKDNIFKQILGLLFIAVSYFFHSSMILTILLLGTCFFRYNKFWITTSLIAWPILIPIVTLLINNLLGGALILKDDSMGLMQKATHYATSEGLVERNIIGIIRESINNFAIIFSLLYMTKRFIYDNIKSPQIIRYFFQIWFTATYVAYLFAFQETSTWICVRINTMGFFPMAIVLGWYFGVYKRDKPQRIILSFCTISYMYSILYMVYKSF